MNQVCGKCSGTGEVEDTQITYNHENYTTDHWDWETVGHCCPECTSINWWPGILTAVFWLIVIIAILFSAE